MTQAPQLVTRNNRLELYVRNELRAYVDDDKLYCIGQDGYAVQWCAIEHRSEVIPRWNEFNISCGKSITPGA